MIVSQGWGDHKAATWGYKEERTGSRDAVSLSDMTLWLAEFENRRKQHQGWLALGPGSLNKVLLFIEVRP